MTGDLDALAGHREELRADGATYVPGVLDAAWIDRLRDAIADGQAIPGPHYGVLSPPDLPRVDSDLFRWLDHPTFAAALRASPLTALAAGLLDRHEVVVIEDQWFASEPGAVTASPWHQDHPYYNVDRPFLTVWVALDDAPADAALRVVPGSHRWGQEFAPVEFSAGAPTIGPNSSGLVPVPDVDGGDLPVRAWAVSAGDAVALDSRTLHAAGGVALAHPFRRLSTRWAEPDTRYVDRGAHVATFWHTLDHGRRPGDLLTCATFPLVRPD